MANCFYLCIILFVTVRAVRIYSENDEILSDKEITLNTNDTFSMICKGIDHVRWIGPNDSENETKFISKNTEETNKIELRKISHQHVGNYTCKDYNDSTSVYLYVKDEENLAVNLKKWDIVENPQIIIPCRPAFPEVNVTLFELYDDRINAFFDPKVGFIFNDFKFVITKTDYCCKYTYQDKIIFQYVSIKKDEPVTSDLVEMREENEAHNEIGQPLILHCTLSDNSIYVYNRTWMPAGGFDKRRMKITETEDSIQLTVNPTIVSDNGTYTCVIFDRHGPHYFTKEVKLYEQNESFLWINDNMLSNISVSVSPDGIPLVWNIEIRGHPHPTVTWYRNEKVIKNSEKYETMPQGKRHFLIRIFNAIMDDYGIYKLEATNGKQTEVRELFLNITGKPTVSLQLEPIYLANSMCKFTCRVTSNPSPEITWQVKKCHKCEYQKINETMASQIEDIKYTSTLIYKFQENGFVKCIANNFIDGSVVEKRVFVSDISNGFNIFNFNDLMNVNLNLSSAEVAIGETMSMTCGTSFERESNLDWYINGKLIEGSDGTLIERSSTRYSNRTSLVIKNIKYNMSGEYKCQTKSGKYSKIIKLKVSKPTPPRIETYVETVEISEPLPTQIFCNVTGIPKPIIKWLKNSETFNQPNIETSGDKRFLKFSKTNLYDEGTYTCIAQNSQGTHQKNIKLIISNKPPSSIYLHITIALILIAALILSIFLIIHIKRERLLQRELKAAGLANFKTGQTENINPDLGLDDQAELLPYNEKWEFPIEKLIIEKQLGSGAFGVVKKAIAKNIIPGEDKTIVAVKMVKKTADNLHIKALATELKIMVHLGQHLNVVNLLGAVTTNVAKRELMVIVEYCRFGNLQNFLFRHRDCFINQLNPINGYVDYTIGIDILEGANSSNNRIPNRSWSPKSITSTFDFKGSSSGNNQADTTEMTNISINSSGYVSNSTRRPSLSPLWRSNITGDYKFAGKPICTRDLISWSFQIARGMAYLASRKVLHGDLAARNVLLADNNIVKICDFGLAKTMYKDDNYMKKGDGPLPIKWMAIESIRDKIFSTQSDVWSFGITCWEIFSLGRNPYPGFNINNEFVIKLLKGYRMERPEFSPSEMYKIMYDCWTAKPTDRPTFTQLEEKIGKLLEDSTKEYYIALNDPYMQMNTKKQLEETDYLRMMCSPDFKNLSSPSYLINSDSQDEGYLTSSEIFSPRIENENVFSFDVSNYKKPSQYAGCEMQMETLVESDNETNLHIPDTFDNPSYHVMPKNDNNYMHMKGDNEVNRSCNDDMIREAPYVNSSVLVN